MKIYIERTNKEKEIKLTKKTQIKDILKKLNISNSSVILVKNNNVTLEEEFVEDKDSLKILSVVSGG
jgi:sulfur carrier protein ThiS